MKPALTPEEWARFLACMCDCPVCRTDMTRGLVRPHADAALALHGQPFGFTREDVAMLDDIDLYGDDARDPRYKAIDSLRARIEALLPPEAK